MKKVLSIFLAVIMILSIGTVGVSAYEFTEYVFIYTSLLGAEIGDYLYFPVYYEDDTYYTCRDDENAEVRITLPCYYDPEILKPVDVTPSELLYGMNFEGEISRVDVYTYIDEYGVEITYPYFYADVTFDADEKIENGEILFNIKMEIIGEPVRNDSGAMFNSFAIVEDLENQIITECKWEVVDSTGNVVHDISSKMMQNGRMDGILDEGYILDGYEPFIPPVEDDEQTWISDIKIAPTLLHVRKGNLAYYPIKFDLSDNSLPKDYAKLCELLGIDAASTHVRLGYAYAKDTLDLINVLPSKALYDLGGTVKIVEQGVSEQNPDENYFIIEIDFTDAQGLAGEYLFNLQFEVLKEEFFYPDAPNIARTLVDTYPIYADYENLVFKDCLWEVTDSKGTVHDLSDRISTFYITIDDGFFDSDYNDLLITDYDPYVPYSSSSDGLVPGMKLYSGSTYHIRTAEDLLIFMDLVSMGHAENKPIIVLEKDIVINYGTFSLDENNEPLYVGKPITEETKITRTETSGKFGGTFEGNGHVIVGLYSTESGLFDAVNSGKIQNLAIRNSVFDFRGNSSESAGAICATLEDADMIEVVFNGIILNDGENTGGLAGEVLGNSGFVNCRNLGRVIGADYCGGLVGKFNGSGDILNCINKGSVKSTGDYVGGIVASVTTDVNLNKCANPGIVMSTGNYVGGIVGELTLDSNTMKACCHTGTVSGNDYVGGLVGKFYTPGDNLAAAFMELRSLESEIDMYESIFEGKDGWGLTVYPPVWATENGLEYLFEERDYYQNYIQTANTRNLLYSYSAGDVTANGEYLGALFGEFSGCVWRCWQTYYNSEKRLPSSGKNDFHITMYDIVGYPSDYFIDLAMPGVDSVSDAKMKSEDFAETMSAGDYHYVVDENNENNGYIIHTLPMASNPELGNTDITQKIYEFYVGGETGPFCFGADETKKIKFAYALDGGNYKVTVQADERAAVDIKVYKNGTLVDEGFVVKADTTALLPPDADQYETYEYVIENYVSTDEIILEITDCTSLVVDDEITMDFVQSYCTPSVIYIDCETIAPEIEVPEVEEKPLFEFGVTAPHIRNQFDIVYYPATFGFSMYDDVNIRYSDICADVADLAFGCDTEVVMKYIYDATTLDFISVYEEFWEGSVEVLEHGSTGMTGDEGQEYNYIIIKAKFVAVGYANDTAPYCLKFAVVEDNFINSDGTIRKVIDNVPYSEDQLCVWNAWDAKGNSFDFSNRIEFKSSDYETSGQTYDDLLLEDDIIATDVDMPTVTFTPEHARKGDLAYYPCTYDSNVDYDEWVRSATGFKDSTTKIQIKVDYDSSTLELLDALPSKELYDLGGTVTIIETGDLYPDNPDYGHMKYAVVQLDFDALDFTDGCLFSLKFRVLQENFLDEEGRPIDLVNSFVADWVVTSNDGKSHDLRYYVSSSYLGLATFGSYEELILADYEPFDPTLIEIEDRFEIVGGATVMTQGGVNYIVGLQPSLTKTKFQSTYIVSENATVEINMTTARYLGTGSTVTVKSELTGEVIAEYVVVIYGDVDGSATINGRDAVAVSNSVTGVAESLTGAAKLAANVEGTRATINAKDASVIRAVAGGSMTIDPETGKGVAV